MKKSLWVKILVQVSLRTKIFKSLTSYKFSIFMDFLMLIFYLLMISFPVSRSSCLKDSLQNSLHCSSGISKPLVKNNRHVYFLKFVLPFLDYGISSPLVNFILSIFFNLFQTVRWFWSLCFLTPSVWFLKVFAILFRIH